MAALENDQLGMEALNIMRSLLGEEKKSIELIEKLRTDSDSEISKIVQSMDSLSKEVDRIFKLSSDFNEAAQLVRGKRVSIDLIEQLYTRKNSYAVLLEKLINEKKDIIYWIETKCNPKQPKSGKEILVVYF